MPYSHPATQSLLASIRSIAPNIDLVRTELFPTTTGLPSQQFTLSRSIHRMEFRVSQIEGISDHDQSRLAGFLKVGQSEVLPFVAHLGALHDLNHYGTWALTPALEKPLVLGGPNSDITMAAEGLALLEEVFDSLGAAMPAVFEIRVESSVRDDAGLVRRRACLRIMASESVELAAFDTAVFSSHLQALLLPPQYSKAHHRRRVAAWAGQLNVNAAAMPGILDDLGLLTVSLPFTRVILRPEGEAAAKWRSRPVGGRSGKQRITRETT